MPAAIIVSASTPKQRVVVSTLEKLAGDARAQKLEPPAIVVIGKIVRLCDEFAVAEPSTTAGLK
jgi:uroporphyrin-III C-methyltransferase